MATYVFKCRAHGTFDLDAPMGQAPERAACPDCAAESQRVFTPPGLNAGSSALRRAHEQAASTADAPPVVTALPGRPQRPAAPLPPGAARLPRP